MLYVIDKKYYVKVGRKFIPVDITYKNNDIQLTPHKEKYIEDDGHIKFKTQIVDEKFKQSFKPKPTYDYNKHE